MGVPTCERRADPLKGQVAPARAVGVVPARLAFVGLLELSHAKVQPEPEHAGAAQSQKSPRITTEQVLTLHATVSLQRVRTPHMRSAMDATVHTSA